MPRRIEEDHAQFRNIVSGRIRKALKKFIKSGKIFRNRGKKGKIAISIPKIDIPHIVHGESDEGAGRGQGQDGDVIGKDNNKGQGGQAGQDEAEGQMINLDLEQVLKFMQDELELPNLKRKTNETFEEIIIKYNNISLMGPESLRHNRRTFLEALKRQSIDGTINNLYEVPGCEVPMKLIKPIPKDKRYRQYKEIKIPSSNALVIYARDGSGSMDAYKCDIVSDMAWWIDVWIKRFYDRVDRLFVWHDSVAQEVDEDKFYKYRFGGGTTCSSALKFISKQFENRYPPEKWNIYVFYFTDGENWSDDNKVFIQTLKDDFGPDKVNLFGVTQILSYAYENSVKQIVDNALSENVLSRDNVVTTSISGNEGEGKNFYSSEISEQQRNEQILEAIKTLMGNKKTLIF